MLREEYKEFRYLTPKQIVNIGKEKPITIVTPTRKEADYLLKSLDTLGVVWVDDSILVYNNNNWRDYGRHTIYILNYSNNYRNSKLMYGCFETSKVRKEKYYGEFVRVQMKTRTEMLYSN